MKKINSYSRCLEYRRRILDISQKVTALHIAPAFSCLEMTDYIYNDLLFGENSEYHDSPFIMSKGHGCMSQYVILEDLGILSKNDLDEYCTKNGILGAHPDIENPGIHASTGSLGHGLGLGVGAAHAEKLKSTNTKVFILISDGEIQEGSTWEAVMMAANLYLDNLYLFVDFNDFGGMHKMSEQHKSFYPLVEKFSAFGWNAVEINGHSNSAISNAFNNIKKNNKPSVIIGKTIKGKGVDFMENVPIWHYRSPDPDEYDHAIKNLKEIVD